MRIVGSMLLACAVVALAVSSVAAKPSDPFHGKWSSIDTDGSNQILAIGGSGTLRNAILRDDFASVCGGGVAVVRGIGNVSGKTMSGTFMPRCANGTPVSETFIGWTYDPATDTLTDSFGVVWSR
jgi:hypothetical protein